MKGIALELLLLALAGASLWAQSSSTVTATLDDTRTTYNTAHKIGINLESCNNYDAGQITKNLYGCLNPGFEPPQVRQLWQLPSNGTTTSFCSPYQYDLVTRNYWRNSSFKVEASPSNGAENGCTGTVTTNTGWLHVTGAVRVSGVATLTTVEDPTLNGYIAAGTMISFDQQSPTTFSNGGGNLRVTAVTPNSISYNQPGVADETNSEPGIAGPNTPPCFTVTACSANLKNGDQVSLTTNFASSTEQDLETSLGSGGYYIDTLSGGGKITADTTDLCAHCGLQALDLDASASGSAVGINLSWDTSFYNNFTLINYPVTIAFDAKAASGAPVMSVTSNRSTTGGLNCSAFTPALTSTWTHYSFSCTGTETKTTAPQAIRNHVAVSGGSVYFDNFSFTRTTPLNSANRTFLRDENFNDLVSLAPGSLRHWIGSNGETFADWIAPSYQRRPSGGGANNYYPNNVVPSLPDFLEAAYEVGATPYIAVPVTFHDSEGASLVTWLSTNGWLAKFSVIRLSFCNECWNASFIGDSLKGNTAKPNADDYTDYGIRAKTMFAAMRAAPGYSSVIELGFDQQTGDTNAAAAVLAAVKPDYLEVQGYTCTNINSYSTDAQLWTPCLVQPYDMMVDSHDPTGMYASANFYEGLHVCGASGTARCKVYIYEQGVSTWQGSLSQAAQDSITAGAGQGTIAALQPLLQQDYYPTQFAAQNTFGYAGNYGTSFNNNRSKTWGVIVGAGDGTGGNKRPRYITLQMVNAAILPNRFPCPIGSGNTYNFAGSSANGSPTVPALNNTPQTFLFCYKNGTQRSLVAFNMTLFNQTINLAGANPPGPSTNYVSYAPSSPDLLNEAASGSGNPPAATNNFTPTVTTTTGVVNSPTSITLTPFGITTMTWNATGEGATATPALSPAAGTFTATQTVTATDSTSGAAIYCTTDGSTPTTSSTAYSSAFTVSATETLRCIAQAPGYLLSSVGGGAYNITRPTAATPVLSLAAGTYDSMQSVTITDSTSGAVVYYTTDGSTPSGASTLYTGPIGVNTTTILKAIAIAAGHTNSSLATATYTLNLIPATATPTFSPAAGSYATRPTVTISDATEGAAIYYTADGSTPSLYSAPYVAPIQVTASIVLKAIALAGGYSTSAVGTATYTIGTAAAAPTFSRSANTTLRRGQSRSSTPHPERPFTTPQVEAR
jgi:Chitobiase/beta-hexosaminidase C-terminal domain